MKIRLLPLRSVPLLYVPVLIYLGLTLTLRFSKASTPAGKNVAESGGSSSVVRVLDFSEVPGMDLSSRQYVKATNALGLSFKRKAEADMKPVGFSDPSANAGTSSLLTPLCLQSSRLL